MSPRRHSPAPEGGFEVLEHTADIGLRAFGGDLAEAFARAALGMFSLMVELAGVREVEAWEVVAEGYDLAELLVNWLNELLYLLEVEGMLGRGFHVELDGAGRLRGQVRGERYSPSRHRRRREVKAATFHRLAIKEDACGVTVEVYFDL